MLTFAAWSCLETINHSTDSTHLRPLHTDFHSPSKEDKNVAKRKSISQPPTPPQAEDRACSPHAQVRPKYTPEAEKHSYFNMREDRAEALLRLVRRPRNDDIQMSTRPKTLAVLKKRLMNQLRVPTRSNPSFHLYREVELMHIQAAKSIFFDLKRTGPTVRGKSVYYNWETDSNATMKAWFALHERRPKGVGQAILRSHGQILVMARAPLLVEHQSNEEAEGIRLTCGVMTLHCSGVARFAPPPDQEVDTPEALKVRQERAEEDTLFAWGLIKELAERGTTDMDRHWYYSLSERFGKTWLSYLTEEIDSSEPELNHQGEEDEDTVNSPAEPED